MTKQISSRRTRGFINCEMNEIRYIKVHFIVGMFMKLGFNEQNNNSFPRISRLGPETFLGKVMLTTNIYQSQKEVKIIFIKLRLSLFPR